MLARFARRAGGGLVVLTKEENMDIMIDVVSEPQLHRTAAKGFKFTGTTVAIDGSEDSEIKRSAK